MVQQVLRGAFEEAMRCCACGVMKASYWLLVNARLVYCLVYFHAAGADKCKMRRMCLFHAAVDLAAALLCIEWGMGKS